jgi:hypothetical protein
MHPAPNTNRGARRRFPAFTIAEVMIAASVMALAIATAITTMQHAFLALDSARNITLAGQIMQGEIERLRLKDWATIESYQTAHAQPETIDLDRSFTTDPTVAQRIGQRFTLTRNIANVTGNTDMKEITLTISWRGYDRRPASRFYRTYYGRNGLYDYFSN